MKLTKTFYYQYGNQYSSQADYDTNTTPFDILTEPANIYINIPFKVKKIHIKNITYVAGKNGGQGNTNVSNYITYLSSLVGNRPVGMVFRDSQFSMNTTQDIEHIFQLPEVIQGYYTFNFFGNNGVDEFFSLTNPVYPFYYTEEILEPLFPNIYTYWFDSFSITMEFNSEDEIF